MSHPTFAEYDRHLQELDQAAAVWTKEAAKEADPVLRALCRTMARRAKAYATTLRELLAHVKSNRIPIRRVLLANDRSTRNAVESAIDAAKSRALWPSPDATVEPGSKPRT